MRCKCRRRSCDSTAPRTEVAHSSARASRLPPPRPCCMPESQRRCVLCLFDHLRPETLSTRGLRSRGSLAARPGCKNENAFCHESSIFNFINAFFDRTIGNGIASTVMIEVPISGHTRNAKRLRIA